MGGYRRGERAKTYRLTFADEQYEGLEIKVRSTSMEGLLDVAQLGGLDKGNVSAADLVKLRPLFERFVSCVVSWNLEDDHGAPVPVTVEAFTAQDADFVMDTVLAWLEALVGAPGPLGGKSNAGAQFPAGSIPMETLSQSQPS
jgi:hypothetical protein